MMSRERWERQLAFNNKFFVDKVNKTVDKLTLSEREDWTQKFLLHIVKEQAEVLDEINFKMHRKENKNVILSNVIEEMMDIQKFVLGLFQVWGFTYQEYCEAFDRKTSVVEQRYNQENELNLINPYNPICAFDLDGVVFDYPKCFLDWVYMTTGFKFVDINELKSNFKMQDYEYLKDKYRQCGIKSKLPLKPGFREFLDILRENKFQVIGLTSRPYKKYSRIYPDTLENLKLHKVSLDALFWSENKCLDILRLFPNIKFFIDDDLNQIIPISEQGYKTFWLKQKWQELPYKYPKQIIISEEFKEIIRILKLERIIR